MTHHTFIKLVPASPVAGDDQRPAPTPLCAGLTLTPAGAPGIAGRGVGVESLYPPDVIDLVPFLKARHGLVRGIHRNGGVA